MAQVARKRQRITVVTNQRGPEADKRNPCPKCGAAPGHSCVRAVGGRVRGQDIGGGYERTCKNVHAERVARPEGGGSNGEHPNRTAV